MSNPNFIVVAGCNGSGKSTFSQSLLPPHIHLFDADKRKKEHYDAFKFDTDLRDRMAWNKTQLEFEEIVSSAIEKKKDFAYETNFNFQPDFWLKQFKEAGFEVHLIYFCLESTELAKERVAIRYQNGGHFVPDDEVEKRYQQGFSNLNKLYKLFDTIVLLEASTKNKLPRTIVQIIKGSHQISPPIPNYLLKQCPDLFNELNLAESDAFKKA